jgi:hypothetical protein
VALKNRIRSLRPAGSLFAVALLLAPSGTARTIPQTCGYERGSWREEVHRSRKADRARRLQRAAAAVRPPPGIQRDAGDVAVMDGSAGAIARRNPFDLVNRTLSFLPAGSAATRYRFALGGAPGLPAGQSSLIDGLEDDDARLIPLPFAFPFYGATYRELWLHSDGNLTFTRPDAASTARSLGRLTAGPPRIAPLFMDLDPSREGGSITRWSTPGALTFLWQNVPEFTEFGIGARQSFRVTLWEDGAIEFAWTAVTAGDTVVGIAPGGLSGAAVVVSFAQDASGEYESAIAERFGNTETIDVVRAAQRFYETHEDSYDYLVFFNAAGLPAAPSVLAYQSTVRSLRRGIGDTPVDAGQAYGSPYRLQAILNMGPLSQYPADLYAPVGVRGRITGDNTMTLLAHETGHLFLALASIRDPGAPAARPMLGAQNAHWSFNFNSGASFLEGNRISDLGPQAGPDRFFTTAAVETYSPLDQYLMGLRAPDEVPPSFLVRNSNWPANSFPRAGVPIRGQRQDVTIEQIVEAEGRRLPDHTVEQRLYRFAFILVTAEGQDATADQIARVDAARREFEPYFRRATDERAAADTSLRRMLRVSAWPAAGILAGREIPVTVQLARPAGEDLLLTFRTNPEWVEAPAPVAIPRGAVGATFTVTGKSSGITDFYIEPSSHAYESRHLRLAVRDCCAGLTLDRFYVDSTIAVLRVLDPNETVFPGAPVTVRIDGGEAQVMTTASDGLLFIEWRGPMRQIEAHFEGSPPLVIPRP